MWFGKKDDESWERIDNLKATMRVEMAEELQKIRIEMDARLKPMPAEYAERLAELEVKLAKLWGLLVKTSPTGQERLTKHGKMFGGSSRNFVPPER